MASWLLNYHYTVYGEESQTILRGDAGISMAGEYRGGEAFTPSVMEDKRKPRTAEQGIAERSKKKRGVGRVFTGKKDRNGFLFFGEKWGIVFLKNFSKMKIG